MGDPHNMGGQGGRGMGWTCVDDLCGLIASSKLVESMCLALVLFLLQ